ncbi:hypothetical protein SCHPADRAFT_842726 [Schizopora paradoxa]|uniref:Uncharacterized protein n=1 Tax=Schizopora paradoxa TaxID=27342 RepID=A0A0H2SDE0_9AGAM|nr:hypothetical protein SCHPADRAFT_842726 [Schizopora paradoxa]
MAEHGKNDVRDELPRVSLDSFQEWQKIQSSLNDEMLVILEEKLQEHNMGQHRAILEQYMQQFLKKTFDIAKPNLRVNGRNFDEFDEDEQETDQFDEALDRRVHSLSDQRLKWDLEIALKRRKTPAEVETLVKDLIQTQREADTNAPSAKPVDVDEEMREEDERDDDELETGQSIINMAVSLQADVNEQLERGERLKEVDAEIRRLKT